MFLPLEETVHLLHTSPCILGYAYGSQIRDCLRKSNGELFFLRGFFENWSCKGKNTVIKRIFDFNLKILIFNRFFIYSVFYWNDSRIYSVRPDGCSFLAANGKAPQKVTLPHLCAMSAYLRRLNGHIFSLDCAHFFIMKRAPLSGIFKSIVLKKQIKNSKKFTIKLKFIKQNSYLEDSLILSGQFLWLYLISIIKRKG